MRGMPNYEEKYILYTSSFGSWASLAKCIGPIHIFGILLKKKDNFKPLSFVSTYKSKYLFDLSLALFRTWLWALYIRFNQVSGSHQSTGTSDAVSYNHFRLFRFFDPLDKNGYLVFTFVLSSMKLPSKSFKICQWSIYYMGFCIPKIWPIFEAFSLKYNGAFSYSKKKTKMKLVFNGIYIPK